MHHMAAVEQQRGASLGVTRDVLIHDSARAPTTSFSARWQSRATTVEAR